MEPKDLIVAEGYKAHWRPEMTEEEYHADKSAVGSSSIRLMLKSPKAFYQGHFEGKQKAETNDMRLGKIIHMALLEPNKFRELNVVMPEFWGYTQKGEKTNNAACTEVKKQKADWLASIPKGAVVISEEELEMICGITQSIKEHEQGEHVFAKGEMEMAGYYRDPRTGILCKIKPDFRSHDNFMITEFKTASSVDEMIFGAKAHQMRYELQLWMYAYGASIITGEKIENLFILAAEKIWPCEVSVSFLTEEQRNQAQYDYNKAMDKLLECITTGKWSMRQTKMQPLYTPSKFIARDVYEHEKELENAGH